MSASCRVSFFLKHVELWLLTGVFDDFSAGDGDQRPPRTDGEIFNFVYLDYRSLQLT